MPKVMVLYTLSCFDMERNECLWKRNLPTLKACKDAIKLDAKRRGVYNGENVAAFIIDEPMPLGQFVYRAKRRGYGR